MKFIGEIFGCLLRKLLLILTSPCSWLYSIILRLRHLAYDRGYLVSQHFELPVIAVGNLHFGGTGKTPLVDFLVENLPSDKIVVCARGYGRESKIDLIDFDPKYHNEADIGEELYFLQAKHPQLKVLAANRRSQAVAYSQAKYPRRKIIILDDALQHRPINPSLRILLCPYDKPYTREKLVPSGNLRDIIHIATKADIIIITKSPSDLTKEKQTEYRQILKLNKAQILFFTSIDYAKPVNIYPSLDSNHHQLKHQSLASKVILVQGVARPEYLENYIKSQGIEILHSFRFPDHHRYREKDLAPIAKLYQSNPQVMVLSTEKDWPKLQNIAKLPFPLYLIPIKIQFLWGEKEAFLSFIKTHINNYA